MAIIELAQHRRFDLPRLLEGGPFFEEVGRQGAAQVLPDEFQRLGKTREHWSASENGAHYRRDVSLGEDASRIGGRSGAFVMATLRNLLLGLMELQRDRGKTQARTFPEWRRKLTTTQKIQLMIQTL